MNAYPRADKYSDLDTVYAHCSGPGGLKLTEFLADKLDLKPDSLLLDIGFYRGYQTCFLAKEYGVSCVGIDPGGDSGDSSLSNVEHLRNNAKMWGVDKRITGVNIGLPNTRFEDNSFDVVYATNTLQMVRGISGNEEYRRCLREIHRVLRSGGLCATAEPIHLDVDIPDDLQPLVSSGRPSFTDCLTTLRDTEAEFHAAGFEVLEADYAPDALMWWNEYKQHDHSCKGGLGETLMLDVDRGRWINYGYVISRKQ